MALIGEFLPCDLFKPIRARRGRLSPRSKIYTHMRLCHQEILVGIIMISVRKRALDLTALDSRGIASTDMVHNFLIRGT